MSGWKSALVNRCATHNASQNEVVQNYCRCRHKQNHRIQSNLICDWIKHTIIPFLPVLVFAINLLSYFVSRKRRIFINFLSEICFTSISIVFAHFYFSEFRRKTYHHHHYLWTAQKKQKCPKIRDFRATTQLQTNRQQKKKNTKLKSEKERKTTTKMYFTQKSSNKITIA